MWLLNLLCRVGSRVLNVLWLILYRCVRLRWVVMVRTLLGMVVQLLAEVVRLVFIPMR